MTNFELKNPGCKNCKFSLNDIVDGKLCTHEINFEKRIDFWNGFQNFYAQCEDFNSNLQCELFEQKD